MSAMTGMMAEYLALHRDDDWNPDGGRSDEDEDTYNRLYVLLREQEDES